MLIFKESKNKKDMDQTKQYPFPTHPSIHPCNPSSDQGFVSLHPSRSLLHVNSQIVKKRNGTFILTCQVKTDIDFTTRILLRILLCKLDLLSVDTKEKRSIHTYIHSYRQYVSRKGSRKEETRGRIASDNRPVF